MFELIPRVTVLAVGVSRYDDPALKPLHGPMHDLRRLKKLLVEDKTTALYELGQFLELPNPNSSQLRKFISDYVQSRSAEGDILIFYFSGHGVPIGREDFGFCTTDTMIHSLTGVALPLSVVKFSELLNSIHIANIIPVVIIDACYSGMAGKSLKVPAVDAIASMEHQIQNLEASTYALLCSCADNQTSIDTTTGGIFSRQLVNLAEEGLSRTEIKKPVLTLQDIFPKLREMILRDTADTVPRIYLGQMLPDFPLAKNTCYVANRYSLSPTYIQVLEALWDNGKDRDLAPEEIGKLCTSGAYCNHNKLSFSPWDLVETVPGSRRRRLTERGRNFLLGKLAVPKTLVLDPQTNVMEPAVGTPNVHYKDFKR